MKKPASRTGKPTRGRAQGKPPGSTGGNKPVKAVIVPANRVVSRRSEPTQTQKL